ncbi:MAG TPA: CTP synthase [Gemmatimonadales bacterium]|nr:CTP synthase [Gemmatimonadales bacterium]
MPRSITVALIGDYDPAVTAHQAIPRALSLASEALGFPIRGEWVPTADIQGSSYLARFAAFWCVPASPYRSTEGALTAIRHAREAGLPFLGTCGGFQHAVLEYARTVLGWVDAEHAETTPNASRPVVAALACSLVEVTNRIRLAPESRLAMAYQRLEIEEGYHCRFGINPLFSRELTAGPLRAVAWDATGEVRAIELDNHPFFAGTLFQPERNALRGEVPPLIRAFLQAVR